MQKININYFLSHFIPNFLKKQIKRSRLALCICLEFPFAKQPKLLIFTVMLNYTFMITDLVVFQYPNVHK